MSKITKKDLVVQLRAAGIKEGDTIFLRISYKSIGSVEGGPMAVIEALLDSVGGDGTLVATAFPERIYSFEKYFKRRTVSENKHLESNVGIIPKMMAQIPDSRYSLHLTYPFIILGKNSDDIANYHSNDKSPYSIISYISEKYKAKCLRVGGKVFTGTTHVSFSAALAHTNNYQKDLEQGLWVINQNGKKKWQGDNVATFCPTGYESFYLTHLKEKVELYRGPLGNGEMVITSMLSTLTLEKELLTDSPQLLLCPDPNCMNCRTSYSYSDTNVYRYLINQFRNLLHKNKRKAAIRCIKIVVLRMLLGKAIV